MQSNISEAKMSANASNSSNSPTWHYTSICQLALMPLTLVPNGLVILAFLFNRHLRTPFNVYLANLVFANFIYALFDGPLSIIDGLYSGWWMGAIVCDILQYQEYAIAGVIQNTHLLISLNRIWALTFPHTYAQRHTVKTAVYCCLTVWVYTNIACLPALFINAQNRLPFETSGCDLNYVVLYEWFMFNFCTLCVLPQVVIVAAYPYLLYKRRKQRRARPAMEVLSAAAQQRQRDSKRTFRVLTASTISATVTWTPGTVYSGISTFMELPYGSELVFTASLLFVVQALLDPVLFMLVLPDLRAAVWQIAKRCGCHFFIKGSVAPAS